MHADAAAFELVDSDGAGFDGVWLDPARRAAGHQHSSRLTDPADCSPSLDFAFGLGERLPTGIKLGPGIDRDLIPAEAEAQWVSVDHEVVELGLWFGAVARPGIRRAALVLGRHGSAELTGRADSEDVEAGPLGEYLYEPDGAVIRARLIGDLGRQLGASMLSDGIAYLTLGCARSRRRSRAASASWRRSPSTRSCCAGNSPRARSAPSRSRSAAWMSTRPSCARSWRRRVRERDAHRDAGGGQARGAARRAGAERAEPGELSRAGLP